MNTTHIARQCPRWPHCSDNKCPLDPHISHPDDKERKCTVAKAIRVRIAAKYPGQLANAGLSPREAAGKRIYDGLPSAVKSQLAQRGKDAFARINRSNL